MAEEVFWKKALLHPSALIKDAIQVLSEASLRIVLIVDQNLTLIGTITDGDIRRGLLKGLTINSVISDVINQKPTVVPQGFPRDEVLRIMRANKLFQIPVVGEDRRLVGLHLWEELNSPTIRDNTILIMAGGKGTRLLPKTEKTPKPMLRLGGKPILEHIIERAKSEGFSRFILAIHHLGEVIEEYFGDGKSLGVKISYVKEKTPLGTAGALSLIEPKPSEPIIVTNGDVLTDIRYGDLLDFHIQNNARATMAVQVHEAKIPYGVVQTKGVFITGFEEKPTQEFLINAGVYVIEPDCLVFLQEGKNTNMPEIFETLVSRNLPAFAYLIHESWIDIGGHEEFTAAAQKLSIQGEKQSEPN
jgi:dTDP-glucose pyrophosphorylase